MKTGILGGTFDPIHKGHLAMAGEVRLRLDLDEVLFIPVGQPWRKTGSPVLPAEHRVEMVRLAITDRPAFSLSTIEVDREGPSYTVDTLEEIRSARADEDELFFIVGWDSLADLPHWRAPEQIVRLCLLVAVPRPGCFPPDLELLEDSIPGVSERIIMLDRPEVDVSASQIRERVASGLPISGLVSEVVEAYIREHGLYLKRTE